MQCFLSDIFYGSPSLTILEEATLCLSSSKSESRYTSKNPLYPTIGWPNNLYNFSYLTPSILSHPEKPLLNIWALSHARTQLHILPPPNLILIASSLLSIEQIMSPPSPNTLLTRVGTLYIQSILLLVWYWYRYPHSNLSRSLRS